MRVTLRSFSLQLGWTALGLVALTTLGGCAQLWRPFLEPGCAAGSGCADLGVIVDASADLATAPMDLGTTPWQMEPSGTSQNLYGVWGINSTSYITMTGTMVDGPPRTLVWAVGEGGTILARDAAAGTWNRQTGVTTNANFYAVSGREIYDVLAVGQQQTTAAWNGTTWTTSPFGAQAVDFGVTPAFLGVAPSDGGSYLLVGEFNSIVSWTNDRRTTPAGYRYPGQADLTSIYSLNANVGYIGVASGDVLKHSGTDYAAFGPKVGPIRSLWARETSDLWAVGDGGAIMHYDGSRWTTVTLLGPPLDVTLYGVTGYYKRDLWIVGDSGTILYYKEALV